MKTYGARRNASAGSGKAVRMGRRLTAALALAVLTLASWLPAARGQEPLRADFSLSAGTVAPGGSLTARADAAGGTAPYTYTFIWTINNMGVETELAWTSNQAEAYETRTMPPGQSGNVAITVSDYQLTRVSQTLGFTIASPSTATPVPTSPTRTPAQTRTPAPSRTPAPTRTPAPSPSPRPTAALTPSPSPRPPLRPAPVITGITAVNGTSLRLTWSRVAGAAGYELWRSTSKLGTYRRVISTTATTYANTYLTPGVRYFYKVRAYDMVSNVRTPSGSFSAIHAGVPVAGTRITSVIKTGARTTRISFAKAPGATGYAIYKSLTAAGPYLPWRVTTADSCSMTLAPGTVLYFRVRPYARLYTTNYFGPLSAYCRVKQ